MQSAQDAPRLRDRRRQPQTMRTFQITLAVEMIVLGALLLFASAAVAMAIAGFETTAPAGDDPRRDDQATSREELLRQREREEEQRLRCRKSGRRAAGPLQHSRPAPRADARERRWRAERKEGGERRLSPG